MIRSKQSLLVFATLLAVPLSTASADSSNPYERNPAEKSSPQRDARGWEQKPKNPSVPVLGPIGAALKTTGRFLVDVAVAPIRGLVLLEDRHQVYSHVQEILYNEDLTGGVLPAASYASGLGISGGANIFYKDLFGNNELVRLNGLYGGDDFYSVDFKFEFPELFNKRGYLTGRGRFESDPKRDFSGIGNSGGGPFEPQGLTRFKERRFLLLGQGGLLFGSRQQLKTGVSLIYNNRKFDEDDAVGADPIGTVYDADRLLGFRSGVEIFEATFDIALDLRDFAGTTSKGALLSGFGGGALVGDADFVHYGAEASYYWTPCRERRVFIFRVAHEGVHGDEIPFTELPRLGGAGTLRGHRRDTYRDELSLIGTLEYRYPIHHFVSGTLFAETGKVAGTYDELIVGGYRDNFRLGYGGGLTIHTRENLVVNLQMAYGHGERGAGFEFYFATDVLQAFRSRGRAL
ncbi:MAG: hypothetical protein JKY56_24210 [Kofleriaceae bacterium]|nr:hypothetical protein [Kofleriaceae bacterium]